MVQQFADWIADFTSGHIGQVKYIANRLMQCSERPKSEVALWRWMHGPSLHQGLNDTQRARSLPVWDIQITAPLIALLLSVYHAGHVARIDVNLDAKILLESGWLTQTESIVFPSKLTRNRFLYHIAPPLAARLVADSLSSLLLSVVRAMRPSILNRAEGVLDRLAPNESTYVKEFYRLAWHFLPDNALVSVEVGKIHSVNARIDMTIGFEIGERSIYWVFEFLAEGNRLAISCRSHA
jgi:hypothetical protein